MTDEKFDELVNLYLDEEISKAELVELEAAVRGDPGRRLTFERYVRLRVAERLAFRRGVTAEEVEADLVETASRPARRLLSRGRGKGSPKGRHNRGSRRRTVGSMVAGGTSSSRGGRSKGSSKARSRPPSSSKSRTAERRSKSRSHRPSGKAPGRPSRPALEVVSGRSEAEAKPSKPRRRKERWVRRPMKIYLDPNTGNFDPVESKARPRRRVAPMHFLGVAAAFGVSAYFLIEPLIEGGDMGRPTDDAVVAGSGPERPALPSLVDFTPALETDKVELVGEAEIPANALSTDPTEWAVRPVIGPVLPEGGVVDAFAGGRWDDDSYFVGSLLEGREFEPGASGMAAPGEDFLFLDREPLRPDPGSFGPGEGDFGEFKPGLISVPAR